MAEVALPLIGLGALYVLSNKNKNKETKNIENFTTTGASVHKNFLPNTHVIGRNYPIQTPIDVVNKNYTRQYINQNQTTDKFFSKSDNSSEINLSLNSDNTDNINTLTGNKMTKKDFDHNNMVPFFGSKVSGPVIDSEHSRTILDNHQGAGNQAIQKVEQAPLFKPVDNAQWQFGVPNQSDFYQSRQLPSSKIANVLPWSQEKVGPGLGLGYTNNGSGGFNSGMEKRDFWKPKNIDEMRTKTNPKVEYGLYGFEGPAESKISEGQIMGKMEKNHQNTDFELGSSRWFTTTGGVLAQSQIPNTILPEGNRLTTTNEYYGVRGNNGNTKASYYKGEYESPSRSELGATNLPPVSAGGHGSSEAFDYGLKGYNLLKNNRGTNIQENNSGNINGALKAMFSPIMDVLRPSRKENVISNSNIYGNPTSRVPNLPITNPENKVKTTIKETTEGKLGLDHLNVSHLSIPGGAYENTEIFLKDQQRNTANCSVLGNPGGLPSQMSTEAWNNQHNNVNKTQVNWPMPGGTQIYNGTENITFGKKESDRDNNRLNLEDFKLPHPKSYADVVPSLDSFAKVTMPQSYNQQINSDRMNPEILSAFKSNPYAQSLNSY